MTSTRSSSRRTSCCWVAAIVGLTFFGFFFDIFASVAFISLVFGLCRMYAGVQRGRAVGNGDFLPEYDPGRYPWLAIARLRFVPDVELTLVGLRRDARASTAAACGVSSIPAAMR